MKTIDDPGASFGSASRQQSTGSRRLTASVASHSSVTTPRRSRAPTPMPALHTRPSSPPSPPSASATIRTTSASRVMSASTTIPSPPALRMPSRVSCALAPTRSATATRAPSRAKSNAIARPFPIGSVAASNVRWPPPTTRIRRPASRPRPGASPSDSGLGGRTYRSVSDMAPPGLRDGGRRTGAHEPTRKLPGGRPVAHDHLPAHEGRDVPLGPLEQSPGAGGKVEDHLRKAQPEPVEIDQVEIRLQSGPKDAAVVEAVERRGIACQRADRGLERDARAAAPISHPVRQHGRRHAGVADDSAMGATITEPEYRAGVEDHLP